jgi:hypothetical protein
MKKLLVILVVMLFAAFMLAISCAKTEKTAETETTEEVTGEVTEEETTEEAGEEGAEAVPATFDELKAAFLADATSKIAEWNQKVTDLETRKNNLPDLAQAPLEEPMTQLLEKRDTVGAQFTKVENATEETFETEKTALETSLSDLSVAYDNVLSLFK